MTPKKIQNFILADAERLPFKDDCFDVVFSSHVIEHVPNPFLMLREMCRVAERKVIVRCPHRKGSGAVMPYHINFLDEEWFERATCKLGLKAKPFTVTYDYYVSERFRKICSQGFFFALQKTLLWRGFRHVERSMIRRGIYRTPLGIEVWIRKKPHISMCEKIRFVVVYNNPTIFNDCFASSSHNSQGIVTAVYNLKNEALPTVYNRVVKEHANEDVWFVFCHQDFIINEDLRIALKCKKIEAVYGPCGIRLAENKLYGMVKNKLYGTQTDGAFVGCELAEDTPVQTLDEACLIAHSDVFRQGLSFDERFRFHFFGADLCMQAYTLGLDVLATQMKCEHRLKRITGDITSQEYLSTLKNFREKWKHHLPVKTTSRFVE